MSEESVQHVEIPFIEADLGENGGRIKFASPSDATRWVEREMQLWTGFGGNLGSLRLRQNVLERQLALPSKIREQLVQAGSLEGVQLLQAVTEITGLFERYADYQSLHSESAAGAAIRNAKNNTSQLVALGGIASSIGMPAHEVIRLTGPEHTSLEAVLSGYSIGRELNVVKRSEISSHEVRLEEYIERFVSIVTDANTKNEETKTSSAELLDTLAQKFESQETSWNEFRKSSDTEWTTLRTTFEAQLRFEAPATYWGEEAKRTFVVAMVWLAAFALIATGIILVLVTEGPSFLEKLAKIKAVGVVGSLAVISIPALTALWGLRHLARLFVTNLEQSRDAKMRETMTITFLALTKEGAFTVESDERLLVLEALFRPPGPGRADDGHFGGALEILTRRSGEH